MANPVQTAQMIRLALGNLAADNEHHSFEHLCRQLAKRRIASNVLPATGPVSAGGDQGRDFETFRTYLADELPFALGFLALASSDVVVFACTIQRDGLRGKFEGDIKSICTQGTHVDRIFIFATAERSRPGCGTTCRSGRRESTSVALEIIDGAALAEWLAEPELYWIAQEYLHLPAELAPQAEPARARGPATGLVRRAARVLAGARPAAGKPRRPVRPAARPPARHPAGPGPRRPRGLAVADDPARRARPRIPRSACTPSTRSRPPASRAPPTCGPPTPLIRQFIDEVQHTDDPALLFDASVLIQFCATAAGLGHTGIPMAEATGWTPPLRRHIDQLLERDLDPNTRACLLHAAAHAGAAHRLHRAAAEGGGSATLDDMDRLYAAVMEAIEHGTLQTHLQPAPVLDLDAGMQHLASLIALLPDAPAYPIDAFGTCSSTCSRRPCGTTRSTGRCATAWTRLSPARKATR